MKKTLLSIGSALFALSCMAGQTTTVSHLDNALTHRILKDGAISQHPLNDHAASIMQRVKNGPRKDWSVNQPVVEPQDYALSGYFFTYAGMAYAAGLAQQVAVEDDAVYISNMFPIMLEERTSWTKGELNAAGDVITFPVQHVYSDDWYAVGMDLDFYVGDVVFDEEGTVVDILPFEFQKEGDYIYIDDLTDVDEEGYAVVNHHIGFFTCADDIIELYDYVAGHKYTPFSTGEKVEVPAEAEVVDYVYRALDDYGDPVTYQYQVAFNGNEVYFNGLTPDRSGWVLGILDEDNVVSIASGQYVGINKYFYTFFSALRVAGFDPNGDANFTIEPTLQLQYDPASGEFAFIDPEVFVGELIYTGSDTYAVYAGFGENTIEPLGEASAAVPTAPYDLFIYDLEDYGYEQWDFGFTLDNLGTEGEYLQPSCLKVYLFLDEELFTFEPGEYWIDEPICGIAYDAYDSNDAYYHNDDSFFDLYINKGMLYNRLGVVAAYTAGGVTNYSDIVYLDPATEEESVETLTAWQLEQLGADDPTAIRSVKGEVQPAGKFLDGGKLMIRHDGKLFNGFGQRMK